MKTYSRFALILALAALALPASAQELRIAASGAAAPIADGRIAAGEYATSFERNGIKAWVSLSADGATLYAAIEAPTAGWVALGLGSLKMNGAYMVLAYDASGTPFVSEETGVGFSHRPNADKRLLASAVKEAGTATTLEIALPAKGLADGASLRMLLAYGTRDDRTSKHSLYATAELPVRR